MLELQPAFQNLKILLGNNTHIKQSKSSQRWHLRIQGRQLMSQKCPESWLGRGVLWAPLSVLLGPLLNFWYIQTHFPSLFFRNQQPGHIPEMPLNTLHKWVISLEGSKSGLLPSELFNQMLKVWQNHIRAESFMRMMTRTPGTMQNTAPLCLPSVRNFSRRQNLDNACPKATVSNGHLYPHGPSAGLHSVPPSGSQCTCGHLVWGQRNPG